MHQKLYGIYSANRRFGEKSFTVFVVPGALNVEVPPEIAANKDLTTVKYDLLIKLAEKFTNQKWL